MKGKACKQLTLNGEACKGTVHGQAEYCNRHINNNDISNAELLKRRNEIRFVSFWLRKNEPERFSEIVSKMPVRQ